MKRTNHVIISVRRNKFPVSVIDSNRLIISSCFFLIPGYYALTQGLYWYLSTSVITTIVSINYWRHAIPGFRRSTDMIVAKVSFIIYFSTGVMRVNDANILYVAWTVCGGIIICYFFSNKLWEKDSSNWVFYHMTFHLLVALEQYIVLMGAFYVNIENFIEDV